MLGWLSKIFTRKRQEQPLDLSDGAYVEFVAAGRTIRVDPLEAIDWLTDIDQRFSDKQGHEFLDAIADVVRSHCQIEHCSRAGAWHFYSAVIEAYSEVTTTLKKKNGITLNSHTGFTSIPRAGVSAKSGPGSPTLNGATHNGI